MSMFTREQYEPWFLRLNPRGEVPVLTDGVKVIPDSVRIVEYLEDNFSNGKCMVSWHYLEEWTLLGSKEDVFLCNSIYIFIYCYHFYQC